MTENTHRRRVTGEQRGLHWLALDRIGKMRRVRSLYFCFIITTAALFCVLAASGCKPRPGSSTLTPCRLPGVAEKVLCGKLTVFENRETRSGRTIDLNVVVVPALDQKTKAEPLFELQGGPGAAATNAAGFYATEGKIYRE